MTGGWVSLSLSPCARPLIYAERAFRFEERAAVMTDIKFGKVTETSIEVSWTAVDDAVSYELRVVRDMSVLSLFSSLRISLIEACP